MQHIREAEQEAHIVLDNNQCQRTLELGDELGKARGAFGAQS